MTKEIIYQRVLTSLIEIEKKINSDLLYEITIEHLAFDLSMISKEVQLAEARIIGLIPTSFDVELIENIGDNGKFLTAHGKESELNRMIIRLMELVEGNLERNISLTIDQSEFHLPNSIAIDAIKSLLPRLEVANRKAMKKSIKNLKRIKLSTMADFAYRRIAFDMLESFSELLLNHQQISLLTALIFVGAGHLPTAEEYRINPIIKESQWVIDEKLFEETGIEKKDTKTRYMKYHEMLAKGIKDVNLMEKILVRDLVVNAIKSVA